MKPGNRRKLDQSKQQFKCLESSLFFLRGAHMRGASQVFIIKLGRMLQKESLPFMVATIRTTVISKIPCSPAPIIIKNGSKS